MRFVDETRAVGAIKFPLHENCREASAACAAFIRRTIATPTIILLNIVVPPGLRDTLHRRLRYLPRPELSRMVGLPYLFFRRQVLGCGRFDRGENGSIFRELSNAPARNRNE